MDSKKKKFSIELIKDHWSKSNQLYHQAYSNTSSNIATSAANEVKYFKALGSQFLTHLLYEEAISSSKLQGYTSKLEKQMGIGIPLAFALGHSIFEQMKKNQSMIKLKEKIVQAAKDQSGSQSFIIDSESERDEKEKESPTFYSKKYKEKKEQQTRIDQTMEDISLDDTIQIDFGPEGEEDRENETHDVTLNFEEDYNNDIIENEKPEIQAYLNKLSQATTELSYLCQHMRWPQPEYSEKKSETHSTLFSTSCQVVVKINNGKYLNITGECLAAQSKKESRRIASLFVLQKIYQNFSEIWKRYREICDKNKGLDQPMNANNEQIFKKEKMNILYTNMFKQDNEKMQEKTKEGQEIDAYLNEITSYKNELNLLLGKFRGITPPQFTRDKQDELGLWPVSVVVYDKSEVFKAEAKESSIKKGEEKACRQILFQIYCGNIKRWQEFRNHKKNKRID